MCLGKPRCPYLGEPDNGVMAPTKFAYEPGDELQITCNPGYEAPLEAERPKCLADGEWSVPLPHCTLYSQIWDLSTTEVEVEPDSTTTEATEYIEQYEVMGNDTYNATSIFDEYELNDSMI